MMWGPASNGSGARHWFVIADDESLPIAERYHFANDGRLVRYATHDGAQRAADTLNARTWADGFGVWHARVTTRASESSARRSARAAIKAELDARGPRDCNYAVRVRQESAEIREDGRTAFTYAEHSAS